MHVDAQIIPIEKIDQADHTFRISTSKPTCDITASIENYGLLNEPFVQPVKQLFRIISGFKRIETCRNLGVTHVPTKVLSADTDPITLAGCAIADNTAQRSLNEIEQSRSYKLIKHVCHSQWPAILKMAETLGLSGSKTYIEKIIPISDADDSIQIALLNQCVSLPIALQLMTFSKMDADNLLWVFNKWKLSLNKQRDIITFAQEISFREDISIAKVIDDTFQMLSDKKGTDAEITGQDIRNDLKRRRFPVIDQWEKNFSNNIKKLNLGDQIELIAPHHFEGKTVTIKLSFDSTMEYENHLKKLVQLADNEYFRKLIE